MRNDAIRGFDLTPTCPSEAILDAFELEEAVPGGARTHIATCGVCRARIEERKHAFLALDRAAMVREIHIRVADAHAPTQRRPSWTRAVAGLSFAAAFGLVALVIVTTKPETRDDEFRSKGSIGLSVFLERDGVVRRAPAGQEFHPGDRLRFEVDLPKPAHVLIVGVEADGTMYNGYPATRSVANAQVMAGGSDQVLPGAVELDEKLGLEVLHLVACDRAFASDEIRQAGGELILPRGCIATPFELEKVD